MDNRKLVFQISLLNVLNIICQFLDIYVQRKRDFQETITELTNVCLFVELGLIIIIASLLLRRNYVAKIYAVLSILLFSDLLFRLKLTIDSIVEKHVDLPKTETAITLTVYGVILLLVTFFLSAQQTKRIRNFYALLVLLLVGQTIYDSNNIKTNGKLPITKQTNVEQNSTSKGTKNIYILLFDGYPSSAVLQKYYQLSVNPIDSFLMKRGFTTCVASKSNYIHTDVSIPSFLNARRFDKKLTIDETTDLIEHASLFDRAKAANYFVDYYIFFTNHDAPGFYLRELFKPDIANLSTRLLIPLFLKYCLDKKVQREFDYSLYNDSALGFLKKSVDTIAGQHKLIFVHFYTPHTGATEASNHLSFPEAFHSLIANANSYIVAATSYIIAKDSTAGIIVVSDHGFREHFLPDTAKYNNRLSYRNIQIDSNDISRNGIIQLGKYIIR